MGLRESHKDVFGQPLDKRVVLDEPGADTPWLLWLLPDGWSLAEHSGISVCPEHQCDPLLRVMRFAN